MPHAQPPHAAASRPSRLTAHTEVSTRLSLLSDRRLAELLEQAEQTGAGIGGGTAVLEVGGVKVFVKRIPLTDPERRPEHLRSTANLFDLPTFYQYGVGSTGFGAWRELAVHAMATNWVLSNAHQDFPLMHHWRVLPNPAADGTGAAPTPDFFEFGGLDGAVAHWDGSHAVRRRLEAIRDSTASVVVFLEYVPQTLGAWLADQDPSVYLWLEHRLAAGTAFMRSQGLVHFDAHFNNILTDGRRLFFTDFGLALSDRFELSPAEAEFLDRHRDYDSTYVTSHLIAHHLPERILGGRDRESFLDAWVKGERPEGVPGPVSAFLGRHARSAAVLGGFHQGLLRQSKSTPYPAAEIALARA